MKRKIVTETISCMLIVLFVYAAISKLLDYGTFLLQLGKSPFITVFAPFIVWALPLIELACVALLLFRKTKIWGLYGSLFLMTLFTAYIYSMLHYSYYVPCSCGGILSKMSWTQHLWFNIAFVLLSILGILLEARLPMNTIIKRRKLQASFS